MVTKKVVQQFIVPIAAAGLVAMLCQPVLAEEAEANQDALAEIWDMAAQEVVTASKVSETLSKTAATVTVITAEDIQRLGARKLEDALKMVPGLGVSQSRLGMTQYGPL